LFIITPVVIKFLRKIYKNLGTVSSGEDDIWNGGGGVGSKIVADPNNQIKTLTSP